MSELHPVGVRSISPDALEAVHPSFIQERILEARQHTISVLEEIRKQLKEGLTEDDARKIALRIFKDHGVSKHWHKPYIRFGGGTALTFHDPLQPEYRLKANDPYYIDLGPVWALDPEGALEYEGDYGDTFVLGRNKEAEKCAGAARQLFAQALAYWREKKPAGREIYRFLGEKATQAGYVLVENVEGHRLSEFPHHRHFKGNLAEVPFSPADGLWVLELQLNHPSQRFGAFYEDLLKEPPK